MDANEALNSFDLDPRLFYDAISYSTDDYLYIIDMKTDMALVSENMQQDFDLPGRVFEGLIPRWRELIADRDRQSFDESIDDMLCGKTDEHDLEYQVRNRKGEYIWIVCRGLLMRDGDGSPVLFSGAVTSLERKGEVDATTGLFAHGKCLQVLDRLLARERPSGGILLLGLDDFSRINSLNDHSFGNGVLRQFAQTLQRLLQLGAIPVINENDTVSTAEIAEVSTLGDNDTLASIVAVSVEADLLVLLSDIEGLYTADPHKDPDAVLIREVAAITPDIEALAGGAGSGQGTGGMVTKLRAARRVTQQGIPMVIANGADPLCLYDIVEGKPVGTRFLGNAQA